jgi:hypothetical protein
MEGLQRDLSVKGEVYKLYFMNYTMACITK